MRRQRDDERRRLNEIESHLWTSDPEFHRQFERAWHAAHPAPAQVRRRSGSALWLLPVGLVASGVALLEIVVRSR